MRALAGAGEKGKPRVEQTTHVKDNLYNINKSGSLFHIAYQCNARIAFRRVSISARKSVLPITVSTIGTIISG